MAIDSLRRLRAAVSVGLLIASWACVDQFGVSPSANAVIVHAVLDASARDQYVIVQTTTGAVVSQKAVSGATVVILTPSGLALTAEELHDSTFFPVRSGEPRVTTVYHISLDRYGVSLASGSTYTLHVTLPDQREVTGSTTIPSSTPRAVLAVPATLTRANESLSLAWPRVTGATAYDVSISSARSSYTVFADTAVVLRGTAENSDGTPAFVAGLAHRITVSAVDANYYDYYRRGSDLFTGTGPISRLNGAIGVFGSIVPLASATVDVR